MGGSFSVGHRKKLTMTLPFPPLGLFPPPDATSPPSTSPTPVVTPSSTATPLPSSASTGFPLASLCGGRSKAQRWCEDGEAGSSPVVALVLGGDRQSYKEALVSSWSLDGDWVKVEGRRARRLARRPSNPTLRPAFVDLCGRRFNCFSLDHQVVECRSRVRCFLCDCLGTVSTCARTGGRSCPSRSALWCGSRSPRKSLWWLVRSVPWRATRWSVVLPLVKVRRGTLAVGSRGGGLRLVVG